MKRVILVFLNFFCVISLFSLDIQHDIIQKAQQYLGDTYVLGGTAPPEFDCSGFVGYILKPFVPGLPRVSRDMVNSGKKIEKSELSPGDLVFFATTAVAGAVSHVALYIGQDSVIHAISDGPTKGVTITSLNSRYWKEHYHSAVRVLTSAEIQAMNKPEETEKAIQFAKGIYTGELVNNEPNGVGTLKLKNGDIYIGSFVKGSFNGQGTYIWKNGERYDGEFKDDIFNGKGTLTDSNGNKRSVVFKNGEIVAPAQTASTASTPATNPAATTTAASAPAASTATAAVTPKPATSTATATAPATATSTATAPAATTAPKPAASTATATTVAPATTATATTATTATTASTPATKPATAATAKPATTAKPAATTTKQPATKLETYMQEDDSPWDTWNGYISGDFDKFREQDQKDFEEWKKSNTMQ
jgi:hypothetical protein